MTDTAGKKFDQHLIRLRIGEGDVIDDQWCVRCNEDGGFGARRHDVPLLERHVGMAIAVARCMEYSGTRSARCLSRYEISRYLETARYHTWLFWNKVSCSLYAWPGHTHLRDASLR